ncbi:MAG: carbon-nitrogen hydrolase family protein [Alphaproteobacteria bacterium]|nr:carbon-nitrogen hydrolase family protein [Alphaproteobacteria bacterium]
MAKLKVSCIQLTSSPDMDENMKAAAALIREAAGQGAQFILTPENTDQMRRYVKDRVATSGDMRAHKPIAFFAALAKELGVWLLIGSLGVRVSDEKLANRSFLFSPAGAIVQTYDKIHMFDVTLSRTEFYRESAEFKPGTKAALADMEGVKLGMGICYDLRFPHLWRDMAKAGAQILTVPAAFTMPTGRAHWEVLLRARAIETGSFVLAAAQTGEHEGGRQTWGHSMIISPWGEILAAMEREIGIITAEIDLNEVEETRASIPALQHDRDYEIKI